MNEIRAFIGHSFTTDDAEVVTGFLRYFKQLADGHPKFSWEHAETAEPKLLTEKIKRLMADKNVFIGICTKKEMVVEEKALSTPWLQPTIRKAALADLSWKTSDWIIQEIGMAIGRELEVILLIEEGTRKPGGLQGDIEYIPFSRAAIEKSFGKIFEMITALVPKSASSSSASSAPMPMEDDKKAAEVSGEDNFAVPSETWDQEAYDLAMFHMIFGDNVAGELKINEAYRASALGQNPDHLRTWQAQIEYFHILRGNGGELKKLRELAEKANDAGTRNYYARALAHFEDFPGAAAQFSKAAELTGDWKKQAELLGHSAVQYASANCSSDADAATAKIRSLLNEGKIEEETLLVVLQRIAEHQKQADISIAIKERLVELRPDDFDARFSLAYQHSQDGSQDLALLHYLKIPPSSRNSMAWNNLGVSSGEFQLVGKAVAAFRRSESEGETLAMANLGEKFLSLGFLPEAGAICEKALSNSNYHKNVSHLLSRLKDLPELEDKKEAEILEKARPKVEFLREFGRAVSAKPANLSGVWVGPNCPIDASVSGTNVRMLGAFERDTNLLAGLFASPGAIRTTARHSFEIKGTIVGRAVHGTIERKAIPDTTTLLSEPAVRKILLVVSENEKEMLVLEDPKEMYPTAYKLTRGREAIPASKPLKALGSD